MTVRFDSLTALAARVGEEVAISPWREISQSDIDTFAQATGDAQWIHVDPERAARESPFGRTIAHGFLTLSLLSHWMAESIDVGSLRMAINYGLDKLRLPAPVPVGSRVRAHFTLAALEPTGQALQATWHCTVMCEGSERPVCVADWLIRYFPAQPSA